MLSRLKSFDDSASLEELIELSAYARSLRTEYENLSVTTPEWLNDASNRIRRAVAIKVADDLDKKISEARSRRAALSTAEEKRKQLDDELQKLEEAKKSLNVV